MGRGTMADSSCRTAKVNRCEPGASLIELGIFDVYNDFSLVHILVIYIFGFF